MWWKRIGRFWKLGLAAVSSLWLFCAAGCGLSRHILEEGYGGDAEASFSDPGGGDAEAFLPDPGGGERMEEECESRIVGETDGAFDAGETDRGEETAAAQGERGYNLPVEEGEQKEAEEDCRKVLDMISDICRQAKKGEALNASLDSDTVLRLQNTVGGIGRPTAVMEAYVDMENYGEADTFLRECAEGKKGSQVIYMVYPDGAVGRLKYTFDGKDMYVLSARAEWKDEEWSGITYMSYTRIKRWKYTDKGWFCYELCVPEPPEVTEIVDGGNLIRIMPMTKEHRELSEKCVYGLGYQGNNLLCSNWDADHLEGLDYNGLYEYLYEMKYQKPFEGETYPEGIPQKDFEKLMTAYLPVTEEQLRQYAVYDPEKQIYAWAALGCFNYAPSYFGTSMPEVIESKENGDGTVTLTVAAVCDMVIYDDAMITHELTLRFTDDGGFCYLGNKLQTDGAAYIPEYQYRLKS